ncbi:MAG: DUF4118 domain-containing protein [Pseudarthrobacter sp.]
MAKGTHRIFPVAAPGVGKTFMLPPKTAPLKLARARTTAGFILAVLLPALATVMLSLAPDLNLATHVLVHLTGVMVVAFVGGLWPAVVAALLDSLLLNYFETDPVGTFSVKDPQNIFALLVFLGSAIAVSLLVGLSARRAREALVAVAASISCRLTAKTVEEPSIRPRNWQ